MEGSEEELGPVDAVLIGYGPAAPMTGEAIPILLTSWIVDSFVSWTHDLCARIRTGPSRVSTSPLSTRTRRVI